MPETHEVNRGVRLTLTKEEIATRRNDYENACLCRLAELVPPACRVDDPGRPRFRRPEAVRLKLFAFLGELGFGYVIRFRGDIHVTAEDGQTKST